MKIIHLLIAFCVSTVASIAQIPFKSIPANYSGEGIQIPTSLHYQIIFKEGDAVTTHQGKQGAAKDDHDYNCFIPTNGSSTEGNLYVSHECNDTSSILGDGGGATILSLQKTGNTWNVLERKHVDFSTVGGTLGNCSGALTSNGNVLSAEEFPPSSNEELYRKGKGTRDTSNINGMKRWQHTGWMVEVDVANKRATQKLYTMGRFSHEGAWVMPDNKTVYLTDDYSPSVFFKFVADSANQFSKGQLYAYQQALDGNGGKWLTLPMHRDSLVIIRDVALRLGATIFLRMEWLTFVNGKLYISETGADNFELTPSKCFKGKPALHLQAFKKNNIIDFPLGAVLAMDLETNHIEPLILGGEGIKDNTKLFSNPDGITFYQKNGTTALVINEDITGLNKGRLTKEAELTKRIINEVWWLDLSIKHPSVDDLQRFLIAPAGAETTGGYFTPDFNSYFLNIQHPYKTNKVPFNTSETIVVDGF